VADTYRISRDPRDYLLIPCRACSADRPNENMDGWRREELLRFDPKIGRRVYSTFVMKPHFVNHNSANFSLSRGVLLDAHYNDQNSASDAVFMQRSPAENRMSPRVSVSFHSIGKSQNCDIISWKIITQIKDS